MTTPLPATPLNPLPLNPPDLRADHERTERRFRLGTLAVVGTLAVFGLFVGLTVWAAGGIIGSAAGGAVVFIGILAFLGIVMAVSSAMEGRHDGPASRGPSSFGQVLTTAPGPQVWGAVQNALAGEKFGPVRTSDPQTMVASRSLSMTSWGDNVTVRVQSAHDGRGLVTVWARPAYPLQWLDYGRNRKYANAVLNAIPEATPVV